MSAKLPDLTGQTFCHRLAPSPVENGSPTIPARRPPAPQPAAPKKLQRVNTQTGSTSALYYQSATEVVAILSYICGSPANRPLWDRWASVAPQIPRP